MMIKKAFYFIVGVLSLLLSVEPEGAASCQASHTEDFYEPENFGRGALSPSRDKKILETSSKGRKGHHQLLSHQSTLSPSLPPLLQTPCSPSKAPLGDALEHLQSCLPFSIEDFNASDRACMHKMLNRMTPLLVEEILKNVEPSWTKVHFMGYLAYLAHHQAS